MNFTHKKLAGELKLSRRQRYIDRKLYVESESSERRNINIEL